MAKERLKFDSKKLGFIDVTQENQPDEDEVYEEPDHGGPDAPRAPGRREPQGDEGKVNDLPSDLDDYSPDDLAGVPPPELPTAQSEGAPSIKPTSHAPTPVPRELPKILSESEPATSSTAAPPRPTQAPDALPPPSAGDDRGQWRPRQELKQWSRFDHQAIRFRVSSSQGPMWNDVVRRRTVNADTGEVIGDERFDGDERPRQLSRALPTGPTNIETVLCYKPRPGHPDPGTTVSEPCPRELKLMRTSGSLTRA